jgi:hypothetical protein
MIRSIEAILLSTILLATVASPSQAGQVYTSEASFLAALGANNYFLTDNWNGGSYSGNGLSFVASAPNGLYTANTNGVNNVGATLPGAAGSAIDPAIFTEPLTFSSFTGGVKAFGGYFYVGVGDGVIGNGTITVSFNGTDPLLNQTVTSPAGGPVPFLGYISNAPLTSVVGTPAPGDFVLADRAIAGVPEPASLSLLLTLGSAALLQRRRTALAPLIQRD